MEKDPGNLGSLVPILPLRSSGRRQRPLTEMSTAGDRAEGELLWVVNEESSWGHAEAEVRGGHSQGGAEIQVDLQRGSWTLRSDFRGRSCHYIQTCGTWGIVKEVVSLEQTPKNRTMGSSDVWVIR